MLETNSANVEQPHPAPARLAHWPLERTGTVIIGGGISGLGCARRLHDSGSPFLLVTDRIGGRMHHRADGSANFGATYVKADYHHVSRYVDRGLPIRLRDTYCENGGRLATLLNWRNLRQARPLWRLLCRLRELRATHRAFRRDAEHTAQRDLLARHPLIARYTRQSVPELVAELGLGELHERYFGPAFVGTVFLDPARSNALFYLLALSPLVEPTWVADFTRTYDRLTAGYQDRIRIETVVGLDRDEDGGWRVRMDGGGSIAARSVVIAVPYHNAIRFYPVPRPSSLTSGTVLVVRGDRRLAYRGKGVIAFHAEATGVSVVWRMASGLDQVYCTRPDPDLSGVFDLHEVVGRTDWKMAVTVSGADWAPARLEEGLCLASDYNLGGLEDSFISGLYAANQILKQEAAFGDEAARPIEARGMSVLARITRKSAGQPRPPFART